MNRKGFTLVELIAMLVVLGVLMAIAIPNISGIIKSNRESIGIEDINKMVGNANQKMETKKARFPAINKCVVMSLRYINNNDDFKEGLNGGQYDEMESVIVITKKKVAGSSVSSKYKYYIRLVEKKNSLTYVIDMVDYDVFTKNPEDYTSKATNFTDADKFNLKTSTKSQVQSKINSKVSGLCSEVTEVYIK